MELLDILFDNVHLLLEVLFASELTNGIDLISVTRLLVIVVEHLPLLLEGGDELILLLVGHEELLTVSFVLFLNLNLSDKVVLVINLLFDLGHVVGGLSEVLLLEVVQLLVLGQLGC